MEIDFSKECIVLEYKKGEYVVYNGFEICQIGDIVMKSFDGINEKEYYTLIPNEEKSTYYIPADKMTGNVRLVLTKEQFLELIDSLPDTESKWISEKNDRKHDFSEAFKSGDYRRIIPFMNGIYNEKHNREMKGKQLFSYDKKYLENAEKLLHSEISFVFNIKIEDAESFIKERLKKS